MKAVQTFPAVSADRMIGICYDLDVSDMTFQIEMLFEHRLDPDRLCRALELLFHGLPILSCRFTVKFWQPCWEQVPWSPEQSFLVTSDQSRYEQFKLTPLPPRTGPQVRLCAYSGPVHEHLLIKCTHQVCDGKRLNHIVHTLAAIYTRLAAEPGFVPEPATHYRGSRAVFASIPLRAWPRIVGNVGRSMREENRPCLGLQLPDGPRDHAVYCLRHLPAPRVEMLSDYARQRGATLNAMFLAAFFRTQAAFSGWSGQSDLRIRYPVDMQPEKKPGVAGTAVTNMVGLESVCLERTLGATFDETLRRTHAATLKRRQDWYGFNQTCFVLLWKLLPYRLQANVLVNLLRRKIDSGTYTNTFSNMGRLPEEMMTFDRPPARAWGLPPIQYSPVLLISSSFYKGEMTLANGVTGSALPFAERLFDALLQELPA